MYLEPDRARMSRLRLEGFRNGQAILWCHDCDFQYDAGVVGPNRCQNNPRHTGPLHTTRVTDELRDLIASIHA